MTAYLAQAAHKPRRSQYRAKRRARPTGCTVLHSAENILDTVGSDTGAENVAAFIAFRTDPGSYHDLVDSDSAIHLVPYESEAFQDGTGSNPWAMSISWALKGSDWPRLSPARRDAFLIQGVRAFHRQQAWLAAHGYPLTPLRQISREQSERGVAGFIAHGKRDPDRRTDPEPFPWARFFELARPLPAPTSTTSTTSTPEDDMFTLIRRPDGLQALIAPGRCLLSPSAEMIADYRYSGMIRNDKPVQHGAANFKRLCESLGVRVPA